MKKLLILFALLLLVFCPLAKGEEIPPNGCGYEITKETNPIYWGYMEDYAAALKKAFEAKRIFHLRGMGTDYEYYVTRDGKIEEMEVLWFISHGKYFDRKIKEVILSVPPLPFPEGINVDKMFFSVYLGYESYDEVSLHVGSSRNRDVFGIAIMIDK